MESPQIDFVIITAIELERQAVCQVFQMDDADRVYRGIRTYWRKQLALSNNQFYEIAVTQLPDVAGVDAALAVADAIAHWHPAAVLVVGIAGAAKESVQLGDLVLGQEVYYYERGKDTLTGHLPEPKQYPADATLWGRVANVAQWSNPISVQRPDGTDTRPRIHHGVIASGERVIANAEIRNEIGLNNRKIDAIEMEGYGVSAAAWKQEIPLRCLVIRGISDRADAQKNDSWQPYAATVAAEFTKHFLLDRPLQPRNPPQPVSLPVDALSARYGLIVDDLKNGSLVPFLGPGINSSFYIDLALKLAECVQQNLLSNSREYDSKHEKLIQALIGIPCSVCHYWPQDRPAECPMLKSIDREEDVKNCPLYIEQGLAVSKINLRYLAQYYILRNSLAPLYDNLYEILQKLEQVHQPSSLHHFLAQLPHLMLDHKYPRRSPGLPFQLVVTTNYDDMLEQAFLEVQQPFDVVFYIADGDEQGKFKHQPYKGDPQIIGVNESARLPLRSPWGNSSQPRPIILKLFGTWEAAWENNFVATEQQIAYLISTLKINLPASLISILTKGNLLFMGYSPNDSDLQYLMNCFWPNNRIPGKSWLLHQAKPGHLEQEIWNDRNVELLDIPSSIDEFVTQLQELIEARIQ